MKRLALLAVALLGLVAAAEAMRLRAAQKGAGK